VNRVRHIVTLLCVVIQLALGATGASASVLCVAPDHIAVESVHFPLPCKNGTRSSGDVRQRHSVGTSACRDTPLFMATRDQTLARPSSLRLVSPAIVALFMVAIPHPKTSSVPLSPASRRARDPVLDARSSIVLLI